jgi:heterodisulfide reductase subunit C
MELLENKPLDVVSAEPSELELDDVDALIQQLEARFQGSHVLPEIMMRDTNGCTRAAGCTGSCPCIQEPEEREPQAPEQPEGERE